MSFAKRFDRARQDTCTKMAYTHTNYPSKKAFRDAFKSGATVTVYQPGPFGPDVKDGRTAIEGPHYPKPHSWYADVTVRDGVIVKING